MRDRRLLLVRTALRRTWPPFDRSLEALADKDCADLQEIVQCADVGTLSFARSPCDLAVEVGVERFSEVQEEILWLCEAAHVPVAWATQVLERMALLRRLSVSEI
jgi:pyruvate kinase